MVTSAQDDYKLKRGEGVSEPQGEREPSAEIPTFLCERSLSSCSRGPFVLAPPSGLRNEQGNGERENRQSVVIIIRFVSLRFSCTMKRFSGRPTSDRANMMDSVARISGSLISLSTFSVVGCEIFASTSTKRRYASADGHHAFSAWFGLSGFTSLSSILPAILKPS